jgi:4-hydroxy-tetrahydrodipicolinate reductase
VRVGVAGALGRLGRVACAALAAADDVTLVAAFARSGAGEVLADRVGVGGEARIYDELEAFYAVGMDVVVDCTVYPVSLDVARLAVDNGVSPVIGATGWTDEDLISFSDVCDEAEIGAMVVPNFSVGAVLMMTLAAEASKVMPHVEIIEMHHDGKRDKPSGTAKLTARRIADAGGPHDVPIHSVRLPGLVAHQEVLFGGQGETLTIRHDSLSRDSFGPGIVLAVRNVRRQSGCLIGLESLLFGEAVS